MLFHVRVVATDPAAELINRGGGRLYVWVKKDRCCGGSSTLVAARVPPPGNEFERVQGYDRFELYLPRKLAQLPDELELELRRFPLRVEAYWNGCAWIT